MNNYAVISQKKQKKRDFSPRTVLSEKKVFLRPFYGFLLNPEACFKEIFP
jgi:hypothetical protein